MLALLFLLQQAGPSAPIARAEITPAGAEVTVDDSLQLSVRAYDASGRVIPGVRARWFQSSGRFEGTLDSTGVVRAGAIGSMKVTALVSAPDGGTPVPAFATLRFLPAAVATIDLDPRVTELVQGQSVDLRAVLRTADGSERPGMVEWSSSAPDVVSVDRTGRVTAHKRGRAVITARAGAATSRMPLVVSATVISRVEVHADQQRVRTGDVVHLSLEAFTDAGRRVDASHVEWAMVGGDGYIDNEGNFVAYSPGTSRVLGSFAGHAAVLSVEARPRDVRRSARVVGRVPLPVSTAEFWMHPDGVHGYLSTISDRLYAIDLSDRSAPRITDSVVVDARIINDVMTTADGTIGVMTREGASTRRNGIIILSLTDPAHPTILSEYTETVTGGVHSAFVFKDHVFLTDDATGSMRVIDIASPTRPREVARWETPGSSAGRMLHDIDVQDGIAYLSYWNEGLVVLDVGNGIKGGSPERPQLISQLTYDLDALYRDVELRGGPGFIRGTHTAWRHGPYVFLGDEVFSAVPNPAEGSGVAGLGRAFGRVHVVDVSDIEHPRMVAWYEPRDGGAHNVWVAGDTLYLGDYQGGLRVVDISGELRGDLLAQGREIAQVMTADDQGVMPHVTNSWGALYRDGHVYVNDVNSGLWVVKVDGPPPLTP